MRCRKFVLLCFLYRFISCSPIKLRNDSTAGHPFDVSLLLHAENYDHLPKPMAIVFPTSAELAALNLDTDDEADLEEDLDDDEDDSVEIKRMPSKYYRRRLQNRFNGQRQGNMNGGNGFQNNGYGQNNMGGQRPNMGGYGMGGGGGDDDNGSNDNNNNNNGMGSMPTRFGSHRNRRPWGPGAGGGSGGNNDLMMMRRGGPTGRFGPSNGGDTDYPNSGFSNGNSGYGNPLLSNIGVKSFHGGFELSQESRNERNRPSLGKALRPRILPSSSNAVSMGLAPPSTGTLPVGAVPGGTVINGGSPALQAPLIQQQSKAGSVLCCRPSGNRMNSGNGGDGPFTGGCGPMGCGGGMSGGGGGGQQRPNYYMGGPGMNGPPAMMGKGGMGGGGWNGPMGSNGGGGGGGDGDGDMGDGGGSGMMGGGNGMMGGGGGNGMMGGGGDGPPSGAVGIHMSNNGYSYAGYIERQVRSTTIMMYTLVGCVPCQRAKHLLAVHYADVKSHFLELVGDEDWQRQLQVDLQHITGALTFPYIFVCGNYIGGSSDLFGLHQSGQLRRMVNSCSRQNLVAKAA